MPRYWLSSSSPRGSSLLNRLAAAPLPLKDHHPPLPLSSRLLKVKVSARVRREVKQHRMKSQKNLPMARVRVAKARKAAIRMRSLKRS